MEDLGNKYALAALKQRRGLLATEIVELERQLRHRKDLIVHVDATLRLLDPTLKTDTIPNKRPTRRVKLFRHGELGQMIRDTLRTASGTPISTAQIVAALIAAGGHDDGAIKAVAPRVRGNLSYLQRRGDVIKINNGTDSRWRLK